MESGSKVVLKGEHRPVMTIGGFAVRDGLRGWACYWVSNESVMREVIPEDLLEIADTTPGKLGFHTGSN
jgi:hypothetical protein